MKRGVKSAVKMGVISYRQIFSLLQVKSVQKKQKDFHAKALSRKEEHREKFCELFASLRFCFLVPARPGYD